MRRSLSRALLLLACGSLLAGGVVIAPPPSRPIGSGACPSAAQDVTAGVPFYDCEASAALVCVSSRSARTLPPMMMWRDHP